MTYGTSEESSSTVVECSSVPRNADADSKLGRVLIKLIPWQYYKKISGLR